MKTQTKLFAAAALVAAATLTLPKLGNAGNENISQTSIAMPYSALLVDDANEPIDGNYTIDVDLYAGDQLVFSESHVNASVSDGVAQLILGTGDSQDVLTSDLFVDHADLELAISIDGSQIGARAQVGYAPKAARADRVPATGVRFGGQFGQVPAAALAQTVYTSTGIYQSGDFVAKPDDLPDGFSCTFVARVEEGLAGTDYAPDAHWADRWAATMGPEELDGGDVVFKGHHLNPPSQLTIHHAYRTCENCGWQIDNDPDASAEVTSICTYTGE